MTALSIGVAEFIFGIFSADRIAQMRRVLWLIIVSGLTSLAAFVTNALLARQFGKGLFGDYAYGLALGAYGQVFVCCASDRLLTRDLVTNRRQQHRLLATSNSLRFLLLVFLMLGATAYSMCSASLSFWILGIALSVTLTGADWQPFFDSLHAMGSHAALRMLQRLIFFGGIWAAYLAIPALLTPRYVAFMALCTCLLFLLSQVLLARRWGVNLLRLVFDLGEVFRMMKGYLTLWVALLQGLSFTALNQLLLRHLKGREDLGGYAAAWLTAGIPILIITQLGRVGYPIVAERCQPHIRVAQRTEFLAKYCILMVGTATLLALPFLTCPNMFLNLMFGKEFSDASMVLRLLSLYAILYAFGQVWSQYIAVRNLHRWYLLCVSLGGLCGLVLMVALIPTYGGIGAAIALLLAHGGSMLGYFVVGLCDLHRERNASEVIPA